MSLLARAGVVAVGSELLTPSRIDTNSLFITDVLDGLGVEVVRKAVVGDDRAELAAAMGEALARVDLVVCCGGLGPTDDDLTREVAAGLLGRALVEDPAIAERLRARFAARGLSLPAINLRQAQVPVGATVLPNTVGTAPGLWLEDGPRVLLLLPGPPRELQPMLQAAVRDLLAARTSGHGVVRRVVRVTGRSESHTEEAVQPLYAGWAAAEVPVAVTILASLGQIELHLSVRGVARARAEAVLEAAAAAAAARLGDDVYSTDGRAMERVVGDLLRARGWRIGAAESCTGGLITSRLTDVPGSSAWVDRSVVAYSNQAKTDLLGVPPGLIERTGAVSEDVARAMAEGIRRLAGVEVGVGVTGIAGPGGGTPDKPVGTVAVAVATADGTEARLRRFVGDREMVKFQASQAALDLVRRRLQPPG